MPELPEVEIIARGLREGRDGVPPLPGRRIEGVHLGWPRHIATPSPPDFQKGIQGRMILDVSRRGKFLVFPLDQGSMMIHLRMSGDLTVAPASAPIDAHDHTIFHLHGGWQMRFNDARKFGRIYLTDQPDSVLGDLGPEPLSPSFTQDCLQERLASHRRALKPLLMDQGFVAGLGNIYVDEALHRAHLHPLRRSDSLSRSEVRALWDAVRATLREGIREDGASIDWVYRGGSFQNHFRVYQRAGEPCGDCGAEIQRVTVAQRGTYFCPHCQPENGHDLD
jgi:formamidopyrimidine-DNA glycosylase